MRQGGCVLVLGDEVPSFFSIRDPGLENPVIHQLAIGMEVLRDVDPLKPRVFTQPPKSEIGHLRKLASAVHWFILGYNTAPISPASPRDDHEGTVFSSVPVRLA